MEGFKGFVALVDRHSGKVLGVSFWESEEALQATDEAVSSVRSGAAEAADGTVASVERYEVIVNEASPAVPLGAVTVGGATDNLLGAERSKPSAKGDQQVPTQGEARAGALRVSGPLC